MGLRAILFQDLMCMCFHDLSVPLPHSALIRIIEIDFILKKGGRDEGVLRGMECME